MNISRSTAAHSKLVRPAHVCPENGCSAPSYETDRYVIESTDGPVEHLAVVCEARHRFHGAVSSLWPGR
jgi:hypothetical protein